MIMTTVTKLLLIILLTGIISGAQAASIHGTVYSWSDFETPLKNVIVEINSTPVQSKVSSNGTYSFENLGPGNYTIKAKYFHDNVLEYTGDENIQIVEKIGIYNIDILLFPPTGSEYEYLGDINLSSELEEKGQSGVNVYIIFIVILLVSIVILYYLLKKKEKVEAPSVIEPPVPIIPPPPGELPDDLKNIHQIILAAGGRITQKDLRKKIPYSEAKVSLMLDDLENRGFIKKFKKGRANIILAESEK